MITFMLCLLQPLMCMYVCAYMCAGMHVCGDLMIMSPVSPQSLSSLLFDMRSSIGLKLKE